MYIYNIYMCVCVCVCVCVKTDKNIYNKVTVCNKVKDESFLENASTYLKKKTLLFPLRKVLISILLSRYSIWKLIISGKMMFLLTEEEVVLKNTY